MMTCRSCWRERPTGPSRRAGIYDTQTETPLTNLYVAMLDRIGVKVDGFGDSTGSLPLER